MDNSYNQDLKENLDTILKNKYNKNIDTHSILYIYTDGSCINNGKKNARKAEFIIVILIFQN